MVKHTQTIRRQQPTSCLSLFDYFVGLALERLTVYSFCKKLHLRYLVLNRPLYQIDSNIKWCDSKRMVQRGWLYKKCYKLKKKKKEDSDTGATIEHPHKSHYLPRKYDSLVKIYQ